MSNGRAKRDSMSLEEATISNMWEIAAIVELLEQKGLCTKQDLHTIIDELRRKKGMYMRWLKQRDHRQPLVNEELLQFFKNPGPSASDLDAMLPSGLKRAFR